MDDKLSQMLNSKMNLIPKRLNFVLTQVLSSKGIESTTLKPEENVLSSSKPSSGVKDLVKHKNLTQLERKNVTSEINSIFSKKVKKKAVEIASSTTKSTIQHSVCSVISRTEKEEKPKKKKHKLIESSTVSIGSWGKKREEGDETVAMMINEVVDKKQKDEYDLDYDKGKLKKIRKKINPFKSTKNHFQAIENSGRKRYLAHEQYKRRVAKEMAKKRSQKRFKEKMGI